MYKTFDKTFELVICVDELGKKKVVLEKNTIDEIDKITTTYENGEEIRYYYPDKIEEFNKKYGPYMNELKEKNSRKERGDITLIGTINKEIGRIKVLYNKHVKVYEYIIRNEEFQNYLKKEFYDKYCMIQQTKSSTIKFNIEISFLIRKILKLYEEYAKNNNKLPIDTIYKHIKKEEQLLSIYERAYNNIYINNFQGIYDESNNEPTYPEETTTYEAIEQEEKDYYNSLNFPEQKEKKGKQKTKKISGGN